MAKRADIIQQAPDFMKLSLLDLIMLMDPSKTNKYTPLLIKLLTKNYNKRQIRRDDDVEEFNRALRDEYNIVFNNIPTENVPMLFHLVGVFSSDFVGSIMRFLDAAEKKQIPELDVTTINEISQISELMSLIQLKNISKKLQKQALKDYEDDEWLIVRPFTAEASLKYGYGTKWCTASESYQGHFFRYTEDGKLVYCINRINGKKVAVFYKNHQDKETELSFWDMTDDRVDSMLCELPNPIMDIIKNILFVKDNFTNRQLNEQAWQTSYSLYKEFEKSSLVEEPQMARAVQLEQQGFTMEVEFSEDETNTAYDLG